MAPISYDVRIWDGSQHEAAFDGRAWAVPGVGESLRYGDRVYRVDSREWHVAESRGQFGWETMEGDLRAVTLYVRPVAGGS